MILYVITMGMKGFGVAKLVAPRERPHSAWTWWLRRQSGTLSLAMLAKHFVFRCSKA